MKETIRVLCVFSELDRGGAESMCMNLYRNIDRNKVQFDFVKHTRSIGAFEDEIASLGGKIYVAPRYRIYNYIQYTAWWRHFLEANPEYQIIHAHFFTISAVYLGVARKLGRFTIGHIHASSFSNGVKGMLSRRYLTRIKDVADFCFACSEKAGKWAYQNANFKVLKNAVDSSLFSFSPSRRNLIREQLQIKESESAIFVVANLSEVKNPLGTLDIYTAIKCENPHIRMFWVGEGAMRGLIERKIETEYISGVTLLGTRSDVPDLLQAADIFMLCSFSEGLPVVTIEAQAAGLPCLLSDAITKEVAVTNLCSFLPIDQPKLWSLAAEKAIATQRYDTQNEIINAGYDIKETSAWLTNFYLNCRR